MDEETLQVTCTDLWDGKPPEPKYLATFLLKLERSVPPTSIFVRALRKFVVRRQTKQQLQRLLMDRFAGSGMRIQRILVRENSIEIWVYLSAATPLLWKFFKDYEAFRRGVIAFTVDVKSISDKIVRKIDSIYQLGWPFSVGDETRPRRSGGETKGTHELPAERVLVGLLEGIFGTIVGVFVFAVGEGVATFSFINLYEIVSRRAVADLFANPSPLFATGNLALDFAAALLAGLASCAFVESWRKMWGVFTGIGCILYELWAMHAFPDYFWVTEPHVLDFFLVIVATTYGAGLVKWTDRFR